MSDSSDELDVDLGRRLLFFLELPFATQEAGSSTEDKVFDGSKSPLEDDWVQTPATLSRSAILSQVDTLRLLDALSISPSDDKRETTESALFEQRDVLENFARSPSPAAPAFAALEGRSDSLTRLS